MTAISLKAARRRIRMAEREACAKIAEAIAHATADGEGEIYIARKIAEAIREQKQS